MFAIDKIKKILFDATPKPEDFDFKKIIVSLPPEELRNNFDIATNLPMVLAKSFGKNPIDIANDLANKIKSYVEFAQVAKPGFINIKMPQLFWEEEIMTILEEEKQGKEYERILDKIEKNPDLQKKLGYGFENIGQGEKINVEFVSCNPTGPMHIGHVRGAIYGDVLCSLLEKSGFDVTREFYINDAGGQIDTLYKSSSFRYQQWKKNDFSEPMPSGLYEGEYLIDEIKTTWGLALKDMEERIKLGDTRDLLVNTMFLPKNGYSVGPAFTMEENIKNIGMMAMMNLITGNLTDLKVGHNKFTFETDVIKNERVSQAFNELKSKNLIEKKILEAPKGKLLEDWEEREQEVFLSTTYGDDVDRPLKKSDGSYTYFAGDVGYHYDKLQRGFKKMVLVLGSDHKGYKKRIMAAVNALSDGQAEIEVKLCEMVNFLKNGEPVKMSKRAGNFLLASDVLQEVDVDIIRFMMLTRKNDTILNFDFEKVKEQSKDNPVFYVQYAHARCCSIIAKANEKFGNIQPQTPDLTDNNLRQLVINLANYPQIIKTAVSKYEPHLLMFYIIDIASKFHSIWNNGLRFVDENDIKKTGQNLSVILAVKSIIGSTLNVCNIEPLDKM